MASCQGRKPNKNLCAGVLHRCKKCGAVGCDQPSLGGCTNQLFKVGKCTKCGTNSAKEKF